MKSFLSLYGKPDWDVLDPTPYPDWKIMYAVLHEIGKRKGFEIFRAALPWYKDGKLTKAWYLNPRGCWEHYNKPIKPTVIYDRAFSFNRKTGEPDEKILAEKNAIAKRIEMVNAPHFSQLLDNKLYQAVVFQDVMAGSQYAPAGSVYRRKGKDPVVIKALGGLGGDFVSIQDKDVIKIERTSLVQNFIHAKDRGRVRDYRIHFVGDEPMYIYSRIAAEGSFYTNVHAGGEMQWLKLDEKKDLMDHAKRVAKRLSVFPKKFFTLDFMYDTKLKRYLLVEINTMPGTADFPTTQHIHLWENMTKLIFGK